MGTKTEVDNPNVADFISKFDREPTEAEYADRYIKESLQTLGHMVVLSAVDSGDGSEVIRTLIEQNDELVNTRVTAIRVANAGLPLALQIRREARKKTKKFDTEENPQMFVITDTVQIARTSEQVAKPYEFQSPVTALRQVAVVAKELIDTE